MKGDKILTYSTNCLNSENNIHYISLKIVLFQKVSLLTLCDMLTTISIVKIKNINNLDFLIITIYLTLHRLKPLIQR